MRGTSDAAACQLMRSIVSCFNHSHGPSANTEDG